MAVITLTSENFDKIINNNPVVLIDFWAEWCGPCRMLSPIVDEISEEIDNIIVGKINVDDEMDLAEQYGVMNIPMLILFKDGEINATSVGARPKEEILAMLIEN